MQGTYTERIGRIFLHFILRPKDSIKWLRYLIRREKAITSAVPWMTYRAIDFLDSVIKPGFEVFEWGGGGSTVYFLKKGCSVTTIESNIEWQNNIVSMVKDTPFINNLQLRLVPIEKEEKSCLDDYISAIRDGGPWDLIVVDGIEASRVACVKEAIKKVKPGGMILLDDAYWSIYNEVPRLLQGWKRIKFRGFGPERLGVSQTDIYYAPK